MTWNKPKRVMTNILVIVSLFAIVISVIAAFVVFGWLKNPEIINKIDLKIPNYYVNNINTLYEKAQNSDSKYKYYKELHAKLADISPLDRFYTIKQKTYKFLINYYHENDNNTKALDIAKKWVSQNDYDYDAKFTYARILADTSEELASKYYAQLYALHRDIPEVSKQYISFLVKSKQIDKASAIENELNKRTAKFVNAQYKLYYKDEINKKFSEKASFEILKTDRVQNDTVTLKISKYFNNLSSLRFDINKAPIGTTMEDINITILLGKIHYENIKYNPMHHIKILDKNMYETTGNDPFFYLELPSEVTSYTGNIGIIINLMIKNKTNMAKNAIDKMDK